jgi:hypothetical protein
MQLIGLLKKANEAYGEGFLAEYYDETTGDAKEGSGDGLARFIVNEIRETYIAESNDNEQIGEAQTAIQNAIDQLEAVHGALQLA